MTAERVCDISEFALIERLRAALAEQADPVSTVPVGIGDDAAVWTPALGESVLITTDSLIDTVHFRLEWTPWDDLGWKALAANISDIAAMGGVPVLATVSLALTGLERVGDLESLYRGISAIAKRETVVLAGGDIVRAPHDFGIHVTVLGHTHMGRYLTRSGAGPGDAICVTGTLGAAAAGLALLQLPVDDPRRAAATAPSLIAAHTRPQPRISAGNLALQHAATAAMDLSDGLYGDLPKILAASGVDATIELATIPVAAAVRALFPSEWLDLATRGGEDYELLLTVPQDRVGGLRVAIEAIGQTLTEIGSVDGEADHPSLQARTLDGDTVVVTGGAFDHFHHPPVSGIES